MRKCYYLFFILLVSLLICSGGVVLASDGIVVETEGMAAIIDDNLPRAKEMAVSDALRNAVEQAVGTMVDSKTRVRNYELIEDSILLKSQGYVSTYQVVTSYVEEGIYYVKVSATVVEKILKDDLMALKLLIQRANDPRVMVIIPEEHGGYWRPDLAAETAVIQQLLAGGFRLVDQNQVQAARETEVVRQVLNGNQDAVNQLKSQFNADLLVVGEASSELATIYEGFYTCKAKITLRVIRTDTGEIMATDQANQSGVDISEDGAAHKALTQVGLTVAKKLLEQLPEQLAEQERSLQLSVEGISFGDLKRLEKKLKEAHLVQSVFIRDFTAGIAKIDVATGLLPMELADLVYQWSDELALEVVGISGSKLELKKQ